MEGDESVDLALDGIAPIVMVSDQLENCRQKCVFDVTEPNSWFGLNRQDYWSWIEPLQDYYFNEKQNPLLRQVVAAIAASPKVQRNV